MGALKVARRGLAVSIAAYVVAIALSAISFGGDATFLVSLIAMAGMVVASLACIAIQIGAWAQQRRLQ